MFLECDQIKLNHNNHIKMKVFIFYFYKYIKMKLEQKIFPHRWIDFIIYTHIVSEVAGKGIKYKFQKTDS
jgi:hypothetical protein